MRFFAGIVSSPGHSLISFDFHYLIVSGTHGTPPKHPNQFGPVRKGETSHRFPPFSTCVQRKLPSERPGCWKSLSLGAAGRRSYIPFGMSLRRSIFFCLPPNPPPYLLFYRIINICKQFILYFYLELLSPQKGMLMFPMLFFC